MRRSWLLFALLLLFSTAWAGEQIDLTTPDQATAGTPLYRIARADLDKEGARVTFYLNSDVGLRKTITITGADATTYLNALNKRNATGTSNNTWTLNQLITKGYLAGTVSGTPD